MKHLVASFNGIYIQGPGIHLESPLCNIYFQIKLLYVTSLPHAVAPVPLVCPLYRQKNYLLSLI